MDCSNCTSRITSGFPNQVIDLNVASRLKRSALSHGLQIRCNPEFELVSRRTISDNWGLVSFFGGIGETNFVLTLTPFLSDPVMLFKISITSCICTIKQDKVHNYFTLLDNIYHLPIIFIEKSLLYVLVIQLSASMKARIVELLYFD